VRALTDRLSVLEQVLCVPNLGTRNPIAGPADIDPLIRAIKRKAMFADIHWTILQGIDWERIDRVGRCLTPSSGPEHLRVALPDATLEITHPTAVVDYAYLAFDGLVAALVNMTDTLGRLLNRAYQLEIEKERASLLAVRDKCAVGSTLGVVLHAPQYTGWIRKVKMLRGDCQHEEVEEMLIAPARPYACRGEPIIDQEYSWGDPPQQTPLIAYAAEATRAAKECIMAVVAAIEACPMNPTKSPG